MGDIFPWKGSRGWGFFGHFGWVLRKGLSLIVHMCRSWHSRAAVEPIVQACHICSTCCSGGRLLAGAFQSCYKALKIWRKTWGVLFGLSSGSGPGGVAESDRRPLTPCFSPAGSMKSRCGAAAGCPALLCALPPPLAMAPVSTSSSRKGLRSTWWMWRGRPPSTWLWSTGTSSVPRSCWKLELTPMAAGTIAALPSTMQRVWAGQTSSRSWSGEKCVLEMIPMGWENGFALLSFFPWIFPLCGWAYPFPPHLPAWQTWTRGLLTWEVPERVLGFFPFAWAWWQILFLCPLSTIQSCRPFSPLLLSWLLGFCYCPVASSSPLLLTGWITHPTRKHLCLVLLLWTLSVLGNKGSTVCSWLPGTCPSVGHSPCTTPAGSGLRVQQKAV